MKLILSLPLLLILSCGSPNIKTEDDTAVYTVNLPKKHEITKNDFHQIITLDTLKTSIFLILGCLQQCQQLLFPELKSPTVCL